MMCKRGTGRKGLKINGLEKVIIIPVIFTYGLRPLRRRIALISLRTSKARGMKTRMIFFILFGTISMIFSVLLLCRMRIST